jgi:glycosyltransferase involved in cell wall biosynthesis
MKIAIDLRPLQLGHQNRGIGSYLLNIIEFFPKDNIEYIFLRYETSNPINEFKIGKGRTYSEVVYKKVDFNRSPIGIYKFILNYVTPKYPKLLRHHPDVFFQADYLLGAPRSKRIKTVVVAYDLIPFIFRNMYLPSWRKYWHLKQIRLRGRVKLSLRAYYYEKKYKKALKTMRKANNVISISNTTTEDLINIGGVDKNKIKTIYLAPSFMANHHFKDSKDIKNIIEPIKKRYLLFIGGTDSRRKADELVHAFNLLNARGQEIYLVFAGNEFVHNSKELNTKTRKAIELSSYKNKIYLLGKISDNDKKYLLENALTFVYPTLYEGFGLPLVESMAVGCPVITFNNKTTQEIAKDAAIYTITNDGNGIYDAVNKLLQNKNSYDKLCKKGFERSLIFNWEQTGKMTIELILQ